MRLKKQMQRKIVPILHKVVHIKRRTPNVLIVQLYINNAFGISQNNFRDAALAGMT